MDQTPIINVKGYPDPTPYYAMKDIDRKHREENKNLYATSFFRPMVYICSPYAGDVGINIVNARKYCRFAAESGYIPFAPHLMYPQFLNDGNEAERNFGIFCGFILMDKCAEVWVFGNTISPGMKAEIKRAKRKRYPVRYFTKKLVETTFEGEATK